MFNLTEDQKIQYKFVYQDFFYPNIVHQTYHSKFLPVQLQESQKSLMDLNPNWKFNLYDDDDIEVYINNHFPELLSTYHRIDYSYGAARADFFRYLVMYNEGGVYLDIKSAFKKPFDEILMDKFGFLLSHWDNLDRDSLLYRYGMHKQIKNPRGEYMQCAIITPRGHPYLRAVIDNVVYQINNYTPEAFGTGRRGVFLLTGPIVFTNSIVPIEHLYQHTLCDFAKMGFIYSVMEKLTHRKMFKLHYTLNTRNIVT